MYLNVNDLPTLALSVLKSRGYTRKDIQLVAKEKVSMSVGGWDGKRGYCDVVDLSSNSVQRNTGSWGGPNAFNSTNRVDLSDESISIGPKTMVIQGYEGHKPMATCYCHSDLFSDYSALNETLGAKASVEEREVLSWFVQYKASYRKPWVDAKPPELIDGLVSKGWLKRNRAGALSITTQGKNIART